MTAMEAEIKAHIPGIDQVISEYAAVRLFQQTLYHCTPLIEDTDL